MAKYLGRYSLRSIQERDLSRLTTLLEQLSVVGEVPREKLVNFYKSVSTNPSHDVTVVVDEDDTVCACATLIIEPKLLHAGRSVGHIEDVVVDLTLRNQGIGRFLITSLIERARKSDCYKVILDTDPDTAEFYKKCGMKQKGLMMAIYF
ncbi:Glucosamine 6-phosphate N-acetyltransferase [Giardia lamblia P15]|uniref:Glucosamine 6-phosphate N-acetyltransferase n=1 Tax=Giardia intestinalis (strain P15) TaxID=658858 RepID=E1F9B4_GIAIA|nr:Glucosamine 6-phosphate N-acetyltransferase [Giardia lamblia P15]